MIQRLSISRFKSIRELALECRKVNVFIGAPDTGKTNILDALQVLSRLGWGWPIDTSLRIRGYHELFHRQFLDRPITIVVDSKEARISLWGAGGLEIQSDWGGATLDSFQDRYQLPDLEWMRFYSFRNPHEWAYRTDLHRATEVVATPHGWNLTYIARHNERVYEFLKQTFTTPDRKVRFDQNVGSFVLSEIRGDEILDYNLELVSDSLKRFFFYGAILLTSRNAALVFDEPDVYAFPPYPKLLGDMIAEDQTNQFFLTTHNPYFLLALAEKTPKPDLGIFVCSRDHQGATQAKLLSHEQVSEVIDQGADVFFNLERFLEA